MKGNHMARYVSLIRFTDKGAASLRKSSSRALNFKKAAQNAGIKVELQLWTTGAFDGLLVLNGTEGDVFAWLSKLVAQGCVRTETMRAFDLDEVKHLVG
jgi:uncharacterized protein with GYD domain